MSTPTIALCMIVRDVASYIEGCLESIIDHVDELSIVDTGSTDNTYNVIRRFEARVPKFKFLSRSQTAEESHNWFFQDSPGSYQGATKLPPVYTNQILLGNYAAARQASFNNTEADYRFWIDSDDIVVGAENLRQIVAEMAEKEIEGQLVTYEYEKDSDGRVINRLLRTRIIDRQSKATWTGAIHESIGKVETVSIMPEERLKIVHRARELGDLQTHRVPFRNLKVLWWNILKHQAEGTHVPFRLWFYLGNESRALDPEFAIENLKKYVDSPEATWNEEKALALIYIAQILESQGDLEGARAHFASASAAFEKPEAHFGLARIAFYQRLWCDCIRHHEQGRRAMQAQKDVLHYNPLDRLYFPAICASTAYLQTGDLRRGLRIADEGLKQAPRDMQLLGTRKTITAILGARRRPLTFVFHTGGSLEPWNALSPTTTGIGGSETAVVMMARSLAKLGHSVTVYCHCEGIDGFFGDVNYINQFDFKYEDTVDTDVFITSRRAMTLIEGDVRAKMKILWLHDMHPGDPTPDLAKAIFRADKIFCVSSWHRDFLLANYRFIDPESVVATRNGIDRELFMPDQPLPPKKNKLIYSSSSDRGLNVAVELFPEVRKSVPDAELHVFYGFNTIDKIVERLPVGDEKREKLIRESKAVRHLCEATEGVILRGRKSQREIAREFMESKVWFYPTSFRETSCITAMEAQAAACTPVTTELAALKETVHHGFLLKPPVNSSAYKEAFVSRVIWCLKNEERRMALAELGRKEALANQTWDGLAQQWEELLFDALAKGAQDRR
jgi:glycosyltransferase involved in cell wall biosynthesis